MYVLDILEAHKAKWEATYKGKIDKLKSPEIDKFNRNLAEKYTVPENLHYFSGKNTYFNFIIENLFSTWVGRSNVETSPSSFLELVDKLIQIIKENKDCEKALDVILNDLRWYLSPMGYNIIMCYTHRQPVAKLIRSIKLHSLRGFPLTQGEKEQMQDNIYSDIIHSCSQYDLPAYKVFQFLFKKTYPKALVNEALLEDGCDRDPEFYAPDRYSVISLWNRIEAIDKICNEWIEESQKNKSD